MNENFYASNINVVKQKQEDSPLLNPENFDFLTKRLKSVLVDERPPMHTFKDAMAGTRWAEEYSEDNIVKDMNYVYDTQNKIDTSNSEKGQEALNIFERNFKFAEMAQAMVADKFSSWFPDFRTIMTLTYDDLKGVDMVISKDGSYFGTSFDITVSGNKDVINEKLIKNWDNNISRGQLSTVKYFQNPDTKEKNRLTVPKFIVGASAKDVNEMAAAYLEGNEESLDSHPLRKLILDQIEVQVDSVLAFYDENPDSRFEFAKKRYQEVERNIKEAKQKLNESGIIDRVECHAHAKESLSLNLINDFFNKKKTIS
jgi:hypothetical protein